MGTLAGVLAAGQGTASAGERHRRPLRVLIATNEPWGTYHVKPLLAEAQRRRWRLTQLVPDLSQIAPDDPVPVALLDDAPRADLLVVAGAGDWPADCARRLQRLPLAASGLAYLGPAEAPRAHELRPRLRVHTAASTAAAEAFAGYLGLDTHCGNGPHSRAAVDGESGSRRDDRPAARLAEPEASAASAFGHLGSRRDDRPHARSAGAGSEVGERSASASDLGARSAGAGSEAAERSASAGHLGARCEVRVVGSPQADELPVRRPEPELVLVLTSVTYPDSTGSAAPGTELLLASAARLQAAGKRILVGLHPREDRSLWNQYEISSVPSVEASARAEAAIGIPGTVFPLVAAVGTPVVGCTDPALTVPAYLLSVCSSTLTDAGRAVEAIASAKLPDPSTLEAAVGPIGGSAARLLDAWAAAYERSCYF